MSTMDKAKNAAEKAKGKVKEYAGQAKGDKRMETEGKGDQAKGGVKQAGEKMKDAAKDTTGH
ncbi:CsbD family protein [Actinospica robiniae]|uniref:CsbD family protein n=1 Tax=Actinospica robiniae TaxID=304901 RepID=UPI00041A0EE5|nr:CsbD family protein [Actinospica robiniae]